MTKSRLADGARSTITWLARIAISATFLYAGASKLRDPAAFAIEIDHYELWPELAPYLAVALPGVEIALGVALLLFPRPWRRAAALACAGLMAAFTFAASSALVRGLNIDCGCFGSGSGPITSLTIVRDAALLAACVWLVWDPSGVVAAHEQERKSHAT